MGVGLVKAGVGGADNWSMTTVLVAVNRWRKYGKDRLYVSVPDGSEHGRRLGFKDLVSGEVCAEPGLSADEESAFMEALASWGPQAASSPPVVDEESPSPAMSVVEAETGEREPVPGADEVGLTAAPVVQVKRWRKYGKDRLYVSAPDGSEHGRRLGFVDLVSSEVTRERGLSDGEVAAFERAVASHMGGEAAGESAQPDAQPVVQADAQPVVPTPSQSQNGQPAGSPAALMDEVLGPVATGAPAEAQPAAGSDQPVAPTPASAERAVEPAGGPGVPGAPVAAAGTVAPVVEAPWVDLATNKPGGAAREVALQKRAEAPVRTTLARVLGVHTDERAWRIGADGEEVVAARLERMASKDPRWRLLHAVPVGTRGSDIDHVAIGPAGVFTLNTKNHPEAKIWASGETLTVNNAKTTYVRNARYEAERASRLLSDAVGFEVPVQGVIVLMGAFEVTIKKQPRDVFISTRRKVSDWLRNHGEVMSQETVEAIYEVARRSTTWTR